MLARKFKNASRKEKSEIVEALLNYYKFAIIRNSSGVHKDEYAFYFQCARIKIFYALRRFNSDKSKFNTYVNFWMRSIQRDYVKANATLRCRGKVIQALRLDIAEDQQLLDTSELQFNIFLDLRKVINDNEYNYIVQKYNGYSNKEIKENMKLTRQSLKELSESALKKTYEFLKERQND